MELSTHPFNNTIFINGPAASLPFYLSSSVELSIWPGSWTITISGGARGKKVVYFQDTLNFCSRH